MHPPAQSEVSLRYKVVRDSTAPFWQIATIAALTLWLYWPTLMHLLAQWWQDPNFSHGFLVPLFSGFIVWQQRGELGRLQSQPAWSGMGVIALGLCILILGQMGQNYSSPGFHS